jgi:uncharacterized membrane protein (UPF0136 family)
MDLEVNDDQIVGSGTNGIPGGAYAVLGEIDPNSQVALWTGKAVGAVRAQAAALLTMGGKNELVGISYPLHTPCALFATGVPNTYTGSCWSLPSYTLVIDIPETGGWVNGTVTSPAPGTCQGYFTPEANQLYIWCENQAMQTFPADLIFNAATKSFSGSSYYYLGAPPSCTLSKISED